MSETPRDRLIEAAAETMSDYSTEALVHGSWPTTTYFAAQAAEALDALLSPECRGDLLAVLGLTGDKPVRGGDDA